uniref:Uncharacterized protein n=1 Tax=Arion vulgaris TaxID=1028688 RepID=A0A0B7B9Q3_9EUPU
MYAQVNVVSAKQTENMRTVLLQLHTPGRVDTPPLFPATGNHRYFHVQKNVKLFLSVATNVMGCALIACKDLCM